LLKFVQLSSQLPRQLQISIRQRVLIEPDALLPYSIQRYSNDAKPLKHNLKAYRDDVLQGKYQERAVEKNNLN
jgi:hypothetical protein